MDTSTHRFASNIVENRISAVRSINCHAPFWDLIHQESKNEKNDFILKDLTSTDKDSKKIFNPFQWKNWKIAFYPGIGIGGKKYLSALSRKHDEITTNTSKSNTTSGTIRNRRGSLVSNGNWRQTFIDSRLLAILSTSNYDKVGHTYIPTNLQYI